LERSVPSSTPQLGLFIERDGDEALAQDLLDAMAENRADFTLTFRHLCAASAGPEGEEAVGRLFQDPSAYDRWPSAGALGWLRNLKTRRRAEEP
jgi:protein adenylyltransferase